MFTENETRTVRKMLVVLVSLQGVSGVSSVVSSGPGWCSKENKTRVFTDTQGKFPPVQGRFVHRLTQRERNKYW